MTIKKINERITITIPSALYQELKTLKVLKLESTKVKRIKEVVSISTITTSLLCERIDICKEYESLKYKSIDLKNEHIKLILKNRDLSIAIEDKINKLKDKDIFNDGEENIKLKEELKSLKFKKVALLSYLREEEVEDGFTYLEEEEEEEEEEVGLDLQKKNSELLAELNSLKLKHLQLISQIKGII